jgi:hypothetical protein
MQQLPIKNGEIMMGFREAAPEVGDVGFVGVQTLAFGRTRHLFEADPFVDEVTGKPVLTGLVSTNGTSTITAHGVGAVRWVYDEGYAVRPLEGIDEAEALALLDHPEMSSVVLLEAPHRTLPPVDVAALERSLIRQTVNAAPGIRAPGEAPVLTAYLMWFSDGGLGFILHRDGNQVNPQVHATGDKRFGEEMLASVVLDMPLNAPQRLLAHEAAEAACGADEDVDYDVADLDAWDLWMEENAPVFVRQLTAKLIPAIVA